MSEPVKPAEPNIAFMSTNDAVEALRKKYGLVTSDTGAKTGNSRELQRKDIFDTSNKSKTTLEIKDYEMKINTLLKQCPGMSKVKADRALKDNNYNMPKSPQSAKGKNF